MAEEDVAVAVAATEAPEPSPVSSDNKRKLEDLQHQEQEEAEKPVAASPSPSPTVESAPQDLNGNAEEADGKAEDLGPEAKRPRLEQEPESDGSVLENGHQVEKEGNADAPPEVENADAPPEVENADAPPEVENPEVDNGERVDTETGGAEHRSRENHETEDVSQPSADNDDETEDRQQMLETDDRQADDGGLMLPGDVSAEQPEDESESQTTTRKMEVPNNKVGVLIGKAGETIRLLQYNSGAKIQITRDSEADVYSSTRPVELIGTLESITKAEKLIKDVIAEADAGGSPSLVARGFGAAQASGAVEQIQIQVPNEKVGLIIGKGGETIKNLQTRSGARIQLIPQHLPEGDQSKERTVRVTGDKKQIEIAREMIKDVMNQVVRPSHHSGGGYNQQPHRPRGSHGPPQWGPRAPPSAQPTGYNYHHPRGMYPSHQNPQYPPSVYGGYPPQQPNPRASFNAGWDQRPSGPMHGPQGGGYDYYSQGGHMHDASASNPASNALAASGGAGAPPSQVNYNYGQPQGPDYGQPMPYPQSAHPQQGYGHGYDDPKYANQGPAQPAYGGHGNPQPGVYSQANTQPGYGQQPYARPQAYGMPSQGTQAYGPPRPAQPGEMPYQNPNPATHPYGQTAPSQQAYPYASGGPAQQQPYPYGSVPSADGYNQPQSLAAPGPGYPQQSAQTMPGYGQPVSQMAQGYAQSGQPGGGYGPAYSSSQQGYGEQPASNAPGYVYQAPADGGYGNAPAAAYNAAQSGQAGYAQQAPAANQQGYEQQAVAQAGGYGSVPAAAPPGYAKNVSPQPGYAAAQYDSNQMYGTHH